MGSGQNDKLLKFLEMYSFDSKGWWPLSGQDSVNLELFLSKNNTGQSLWTLKQGSVTLIEGSHAEVIGLVEKKYPQSLLSLERQLQETILNHAIYANTLLDQTRELLGEQAVSKALQDHEEFISQLLAAVRDATGELHGSKEKSPYPKPGKLRLVPSNIS
jgi:hypothetical protein